MKNKYGCLGYIGDEKLPSYEGTTINHYKEIPIETTSLTHGKKGTPFFFFVAQFQLDKCVAFGVMTWGEEGNNWTRQNSMHATVTYTSV